MIEILWLAALSVAGSALVLAIFALWRLGHVGRRLDEVQRHLDRLEIARTSLRSPHSFGTHGVGGLEPLPSPRLEPPRPPNAASWLEVPTIARDAPRPERQKAWRGEPETGATAFPAPVAERPSHAPMPEPSPSRVVSQQEARSIFDRWCIEGPPRPDGDVELHALSFIRAEKGAAGKIERFVLEDSPQVSHFVRVGGIGRPDGFLFPHPDSVFSPYIQMVFSHVSHGNFEDSKNLVGTMPMRIHRTAHDRWEAPCPS